MNYPLLIIKIVCVALISAALYLVYDKIYTTGYTAAEAKYTEIIKKNADAQEAKLKSVELSLQTLVENTTAFNMLLSEDITKIKSNLNGKTLVVFKDGKCTLTKDFLDSRNEAINRANKK